jgi:hypothetical protein
MRRVMTAFVLAGAIALTAPCALFTQRGGGGHASGFSGGHTGGGFSGGHAGGFSGGGFTAPHFTAPSGGIAPRSFPAPRMGMMPRPIYPGAARFAPNLRPYSGSPLGQLNNPAVRRSPYAIGNRGWTNPPYRSNNWQGSNNWHGGNNWHSGDHNGHYYRPPYYVGYNNYYTYWPPYYPYGYWPWTPYLGGWDSEDYSSSDQNASPDQYQYQNQYPYQYPDQNSAPDPPDEDAARPAYQPPIIASPGVAISEPTVIIVYKDGHAEQVHNYALTPTRLLLMDNASAGFSLQVPLALIDLPATVQANRAAGVDFRLPVQN